MHPALVASLYSCKHRAIPQAHLIFQDIHWKLTVLIQYLPYQSLVHPPFNLPANTVQNEGLNRDDVHEHDEKQAAKKQKT